MANDAQIIIGADTSELVAALKGAQEAVSASVAEMKSSLGGLGGAFEALSGAFLGITAVLAGGKMFKDAINASLEFTAQVKGIAKVMGVTTEEASVMNVALKLIGKTSDDLTGASMKLLKQIKANETAINDMGLQTKDSNGHLRSMMDLTLDAVNLLKDYKEGVDRDAAAMYMFGRSAKEVMELQKLNSTVMERANELAEKYHLKIGAEGVESAKKYKMAQAELAIVWEGVCGLVGEVLIPILTDLAAIFGQIAYVLFSVLKISIDVVVVAFDSLYNIVLQVGIGVAKLAQYFGADMTASIAAMEAQVTASDKRIRAMIGKPIESGNKEATDNKGTKQFKGFGDKNKKDPSRVGEWDARLAEAKVYYQKENDLRDMSKEQEKAYWQSIQKTQSLTNAESIELRKKVAALDLEIMKKSVKDGQGLAKEAITEYQRNGLDEIAIEEEKSKRKKDLGEISAQDFIKLQQTYENQRYAIEEIAQNARIELQRNDPSQDPVALQVQLDKLLELRQKHAKQVEQLNTSMANQVKADFQSMLAPIENAVSTSVTGMIQGTTTLKAAMANLMQSILGSFVSAITSMVAKWAAGEMAKTGLAQSWSTVRQALFGEEVLTAVAAKKLEAAGTIPAETGVAAMGAASAVASIPIVGPAMAVAAAAEMSAMGAGYLALASASGGFDIPANANPLTQLHASEMVLPAHIANPLRDSLAGGGIGGGDTHLHVHAVDAPSVERLFRDNGHLLAREMRRQSRNFAPTKA